MIWLLLVIVLYILYRVFKNKLPPGPLGNNVPFLGYLPFIDPKKPYETLMTLAKQHGPIYGLQLGSIYCVVLSDATIIRDAFKREEFTGRAPLYVTHGIMDNCGIICTEGQLWKDQRNLVIKWLKDIGMVKYGAKRMALEGRIMAGVEESIKEFNDKIKDVTDINPVDILNHNFGNVVNDLVFGVKYDRDDETWKYLQHLQEEGVKYIGICGAVNFLPILRFLPSNKKVMNFLMTGIVKTHKIYDNIINNCQNKLDQTPNTSSPNEQKDCMLRYFLMERQFRESVQHEKVMNCSQKQLRFLLADLYGASFDTTFTTVRWFLYFVAKNHHVQERLFQEMKIFEKDGMISLDSLENIPYFKATVAEVLRIRSVVPAGIPHGTNEDSKLCGYHIPKNSMILPLQWCIHMNDTNWTEPFKFNPERFIDDEGKFFTPSFYVPFQVGKRMCVGEELAKMLLYSFSANIVLNFDLKFTENVNDHFDDSGVCGITLAPDDYQLTFQKRFQLKKQQ